jgi:glutaredoxin 3
MAEVIIYTTYYCPYCSAAKSLFRSKNVDFIEIDVSEDRQLRTKIEQLSGRRTVPQIFINGKPIGGYDDARELDAAGELDVLLSQAPPSS